MTGWMFSSMLVFLLGLSIMKGEAFAPSLRHLFQRYRTFILFLSSWGVMCASLIIVLHPLFLYAERQGAHFAMRSDDTIGHLVSLFGMLVWALVFHNIMEDDKERAEMTEGEVLFAIRFNLLCLPFTLIGFLWKRLVKRVCLCSSPSYTGKP